MSTITTQTPKQPAVLKLSFFTAMCERFGFYVLTFLIVLYAKSEYGLSDSEAFLLYGAFSALAYLTTAAGGYLADNVFGVRRCIIFGLICESAGLMLLAIQGKTIFSIALGLIIVGVGLFKTGPTHLLGRSYKENDPRIDSGFTLYYMGMNIGSFTSSLLASIIQLYFGWHIAFLYGGVGIALGLIAYFIFRKTAIDIDSEPGKQKLPIKTWQRVIAGMILVAFAGAFLVTYPNLTNIFLIIATLGLFGYFIYEIIKSPKNEQLKIIACLSLIAMGLIFFILYQQAYTSMVLFINRCVDRHAFGKEIQTAAFFGLNPFWVVVLSPILAALYNHLNKRGKVFPITVKFPIGVLLISLCFASLVTGSHFASNPSQVSPWWVVLAYLLYTAGEMFVSALGPAMITQIAPKRMYGVMMGTWFVVTMSLSAILGSMFAGLASVPDTLTDQAAILSIYSQAFTKFGIAAIILAAICFAVGPMIKRMAEEKKQ